MNLKSLVKLSNIVALISIVLLVYWVFVFIATNVFGFRIFRERISETFAMSVLGIIALMAGSLMINVMFNLTRIAERHNRDEISEMSAVSKKLGLAFLLSFPIIFGLLLGGDYLTSKKKESMLIQSAQSIIENHTPKADEILSYQFSKDWIIETRDNLDLMSKTDKNFPYVSVIVKDSIDNSDVFLGFRDYSEPVDENIQPQKRSFIFPAIKADRDYLNKVFDENYNEIKFNASEGNYELFYPYIKDNKKIVLYFSDYQRYGKLGS